ncbi:MAG: helix-turn-helix transcriptional regulator [Oscillospiraceae bacterium]|nr:helix-turn-helix transcriptional regulator [Oscillospiraceae bacterium]
MAKILALNGLIHSKFDSEAKMADALGWPRQRLNKITNGDKEPDLVEVREMAAVLDESFMTVANIFLAKKSPDGDN